MISNNYYYRNTTPDEESDNPYEVEEKKWYQITDSILGFAEEGGDIWNRLKYGSSYVPPGSPGYVSPQPQMSTASILAIVAIGGIVIFSIIKLSK
jgi:hypothetical protein